MRSCRWTTQKLMYKGFKSTILLQLVSNEAIYSTPKMVIPIINTESQFLKLVFFFFFKLQVLNTLCVWVFFFFWKWECLTFPLEIGFSRKAILKNPQKTKAVHIVSLEYFLPIFFKLTKQNKTKSFSGTKGKKQNKAIKQWFWKQNEVWPIDLRIKRHYISSFLLASHWYLNADSKKLKTVTRWSAFPYSACRAPLCYQGGAVLKRGKYTRV